MGKLSRGELSSGIFASGSKSWTLGVFIGKVNQPVGKHIIGNCTLMFWVKLRYRRFLIVGAAKDRGMGNFNGQNIITPNFSGIGNNSRGVGSRRTVHGKEDAKFVMGKRILIPHDTLYVVDTIGNPINSHAFSRC